MLLGYVASGERGEASWIPPFSSTSKTTNSANGSPCAAGLFLCSFYTEIWQFYISGIIEGAGLCVILFLPATLFFIRSYPEEVGLKPFGPPRDDLPEASAASEGAPMRPGIEAAKAFRMPAFYTIMITFMLTNATAQLGNYLPSYLHHLADLGVAGLTPATVVMTASIVAACLQTAHALAKIGLGQVADHSLVVALVIGVACGACGILLVWQGCSSQTMIAIGAALFGVHFGMTNVLGPSFTLRLFGPRDYAKIYSRITSVMNIMPAVALVVFSALSEASWDALFIVVLLLIAIVFCTGMATVLLGRRMDAEREGAAA